MTGRPDFNFPAFNAEAGRLRALGWNVINPVEISPDPHTPWAQCLRADVKALCECDGIALLDGWQYSDGAHLELNLAHRLQMHVLIARDITTGPGETTCGM